MTGVKCPDPLQWAGRTLIETGRFMRMKESDRFLDGALLLRTLKKVRLSICRYETGYFSTAQHCPEHSRRVEVYERIA